MYCTCRNNNATICWRKVNCDFLSSCLKNDNCNRFQNLNKSIVGQLLGNSFPNLYSRDTFTVYSGNSSDNFLSTEGVPSPEQWFHCSNFFDKHQQLTNAFQCFKISRFSREACPRKNQPFVFQKQERQICSMQQ